MGIAGAIIRGSVHTEVLRLSRAGESVLVSGASGSGKSHLLDGIARHLDRGGTEVHTIDCGSATAADDVATAGSTTVLVLDGLEMADENLLRACIERMGPGQSMLMSLTIGPQHAALMHMFDAIAGSLPRARSTREALHRVELEPVSDADLERLLHERSRSRLNSATIHQITILAAGRPGWAVDLLELAQHGYLSERPRPGIIDAPHSELDLPALRALTRSLGTISVAAATAALALSELGPIDLPGARDLVGADTTSELIAKGALGKEPNSELFSVPVFVATALRPRANAELLEQRREAVAHRLMTQEAIGIPLSEAELLLCARSLRANPADGQTGLLSRARTRVLQQAAANLISFNGEIAARTLLLRSGALDAEPSPLQHARTLSALAGPVPAFDALSRAPQPTTTPEFLLHGYHLAQFAAESGAAVQPASTSVGATETLAAERDATPEPTAALQVDAATVFQLWNDTADIATRVHELPPIARRSSSPEVAALATALANLEQVWQGQLPPGSWLAKGSPIPYPVHQATELTRTVSGTLLLANALTVLLAGEQALRTGELLAAVAHTVPRDSHTRWLRHLLAAGNALVCGDMARAHLEWELLITEAPRFIPLRLRSYLERIGAAIRHGIEPGIPIIEGLPEPEDRFVPLQITRYLAGQHDVLDPAPPQAGNPLNALPVIRLAHAHLQAASDQNPAELLRAASRLMRLELWAPTAFALRTARLIYLSRRAVGGVQQCDERLAELEERVSRSIPWYRPGDLPVVNHTRLTPRERETAALAAEGFSNREIASRLGRSVRTVESHLAQARAKLGSSSRKDLAGRLASVGGAE